jgi:hypothetical protein
MQIVWNKEIAEKISNSHTVLPLETITVDGKEIETFCVIPAEKISLGELASVEQYKDLHNGFLKAMNENNYKLCKDIADHLKGKFGGELDSFYEVILERFKNKNISESPLNN